jgi:hypothetical protein
VLHFKLGGPHAAPDVANDAAYVKRALAARDGDALLAALQDYNANLPPAGLKTFEKKLAMMCADVAQRQGMLVCLSVILVFCVVSLLLL